MQHTKVPVRLTEVEVKSRELPVDLPTGFSEADKERLEDVGFLTAMTLVLMGNYAQTGHFGGPLSYTPANVVTHLAGGKNGGLSYDVRHPKHPFGDKFMLTGGHCIPTCYALWMVLYEAMARQYASTADEKYKVDPDTAILSIDALGFRRSKAACDELLKKAGLEEHELFKQAKLRGIRALMGHSETTDATNDVNGGPSGIGVANSAGKAVFWDAIGAPSSLKVIAFEGEFAFTEGHAQELKTMALAQQVGKRLRLFFSYNNAGIDDALIGGVIPEKYGKQYDMANQFYSYGWNVFELEDGASYEALVAVFKAMEEWPEEDRRPMVVIAKTIKGWWPGALDDKIGRSSQIVGYKSHPYGFALNSEYFVTLAESFETKYGVKFEGIHDGPPKGEKARLIQFKQNIDIALSVLDKNGLGEWIANRLLEIADEFNAERTGPKNKSPFSSHLGIPSALEQRSPFKDERLRVDNLPTEPVKVVIKHPTTGEEINSTISLFVKAGEKKGTRRAISEIGKWVNYVTDNRLLTVAADLSNSINVEACNFTGHYDPVNNPRGTRLKAGIQECVNAATMCGIVSQTVSADPDEHLGLWGISGTYGAFTPLMYLPLRIFSQQNQDSPFALGVVTIIAGHSGPETAADARSHFGVFAPQVWTLFPEGQVINLYFWDYNDVAAGYFAALETAANRKECGIIVVHVARPDMVVADRSQFADTDLKAAAKGCYLIRDYDPSRPPMGTVLVQGASSTTNLLAAMPELEEEGINVRIVAVISEELFRQQSEEYQERVMPLSAKYDCMVVTTMTKRIMPLSNLGPLTKEYSLSSDFDDRWRTGGLEEDVIAEAHLDSASIRDGIRRFALDRKSRLERQRQAFQLLE
ncbi:putative Transketolase [Balamuthia mandrillaris]